MEEVIITQEEWLAQEQKRMAYWEKQKKECYVEKPLNTYKECWNDVNKWVAFDPHHSNHSWIIFDRFQKDYVKYPIEFQMKLLIDMYIYEIPMNLRKFNAVIRKIFKTESKELKSNRTQEIRQELKSLNLIECDENGKEYITVYRGINHKSTPSDIAISWTYNIEIAKWFANRFACLHKDDRCCKVQQGKIYIKDILSIEHGRKEDEIIAFPLTPDVAELPQGTVNIYKYYCQRLCKT